MHKVIIGYPNLISPDIVLVSRSWREFFFSLFLRKIPTQLQISTYRIESDFINLYWNENLLIFVIRCAHYGCIFLLLFSFSFLLFCCCFCYCRSKYLNKNYPKHVIQIEYLNELSISIIIGINVIFVFRCLFNNNLIIMVASNWCVFFDSGKFDAHFMWYNVCKWFSLFCSFQCYIIFSLLFFSARLIFLLLFLLFTFRSPSKRNYLKLYLFFAWFIFFSSFFVQILFDF